MADLEKKPTSTSEPHKGGPLADGSSMSGSHNNDLEKGTTMQLQRRLQARHLQMIAIGGTIGTGLVSETLRTISHVYVTRIHVKTTRGR